MYSQPLAAGFGNLRLADGLTRALASRMEAALRRHKCSLVLVVLLLASAIPAAAQDARALLATLQSQLRAGQLEAARQTARRYVALDGANPSVWYNLAGLEEHAGHRDAAIAAMTSAVAAGFDDFRAAEDDADLGALRLDPAFRALYDASRRALRQHCAGREVRLTAGAWSPWRELTDRDRRHDAPTTRLRLRCTGDHLEIEAEVHDANPADALPPWQGGAGLVVAVAAPDDANHDDGVRFQEIAAGLQQKLPVGAILADRWQQLVELAPKLRYDPATKGLVYTLRIPWAALSPHDPLLDGNLLLNVTYLALLPTGGRSHASLVHDPAVGNAAARWRRGVALRVDWPAASGPLLRVRPTDAVVAPGSGGAAATVVAPNSGPARWEARPPFAGRGNVALRAGRQDVPLSLQHPTATGPAALVAALTLPDGRAIEARTEVLVLPADWSASARRRADRVPAAERSSVLARIDAVTQELRTRHPHDPVGALGSTVAEAEVLLDRAAATGTTLPASGPYLAILPAAGTAPPLACAVHIPDGFRRDGRHVVLLLFLQAPGHEARGADLALRALAEMAPRLGVDPARVAVVVPVATGTPPPDVDAAGGIIATTIAWARAVMPGVPLALAGVDAFATPVLQASLNRPTALAGVLLVTGAGFAPWPGADDLALRAALAGADRRLSYGWIRFPDETGPDDRALDVIRAMRDTGLALHNVQEVPGDLHASQAWGRAVIWAAGLP